MKIRATMFILSFINFNEGYKSGKEKKKCRRRIWNRKTIEEREITWRWEIMEGREIWR